MRSPPLPLLQGLVFGLVAAAFTTIYMTQPVLPIIQTEFTVDAAAASLTVSAVIFGIALSNLPFGVVADVFPIRPTILVGGIVVSVCGVFCYGANRLWPMVAARFIQGLFIPALTTCLAAYLSRMLPREKLNTVMGAYIAATVAGGLGGRLIGGWLHDPSHWRHAFLSTSILVLITTLIAVFTLPKERGHAREGETPIGFFSLLRQKNVQLSLAVSFSAFYVFSSIFNYMPFYLSASPFEASTRQITLAYLSYIFGIVAAPLAGRLSNRFGNGPTMVGGSIAFALAIGSTFIAHLSVIAVSLAGVCTGFFTIHTAAIGALNRELSQGKGRANALYILSYYMGGATGVTLSGLAYERFQWAGVAFSGCLVLFVPAIAGIVESRGNKR